MIFLHFILGLIIGKLTGNIFLFTFFSILPDIDHLYIIIKNKIFSKKKLIDSLKNEENYSLRFKTPFMHSILGAAIISMLYYFFTLDLGTLYLASSAYLLHLLLDWPDKDKKQFLFPLKKEFSGFLPIWSIPEQIITFISLIVLLCIYF